MSLLFEKNKFPEPKYKVFVSYHHCIEDQEYRNHLEEILMANQDVVLIKSPSVSDIDHDLDLESIRQKIRVDYLKDSTVTIVLIGLETWKKKNVDWEIDTSLREFQHHSKSGLLGIILPAYHSKERIHQFNPHTVPPRLYDNIKCGFATVHDWDTDPFIVQEWIHDAYERRNKLEPDNCRSSFSENLFGREWQ